MEVLIFAGAVGGGRGKRLPRDCQQRDKFPTAGDGPPEPDWRKHASGVFSGYGNCEEVDGCGKPLPELFPHARERQADNLAPAEAHNE